MTVMDRLRGDGFGVLGDGESACRWCGVAVEDPGEVEEVRVYGSSLRPDAEAQGWRVPLTVCAACEPLTGRAEVLAGQYRVHLDAARRVVALAEALDRDPDDVVMLASDDAPGCSWEAALRRTPTLAAQSRCAARPWGHLDDVLLGAARRAVGAVLARRVRKASGEPVSPPPVSGSDAVRSGCLLCGVARSVSWQRFTPNVSQVGASGGGWVAGHLCDVCMAVRLEGHPWPFSAVVAAMRRAGADITGEAAPFPIGRYTFAGRVLAARRRGEAEPSAGESPFAWVDLTDVRVQPDLSTGERLAAEVEAAEAEEVAALRDRVARLEADRGSGR